LGFSIEEARSELSRLEDFFEILHEDEASYDIWKDLIVANRVNGVQVHDARLVAVMMAHGIRQIVTFDMGDFRRYAAIEAIHPDKIE
jgi:predicted nucleic acid-binding protein